MTMLYGRREDDSILDPEEVNEAYRDDQTADIAIIAVPDDVVAFIEEQVKPHVGVTQENADQLEHMYLKMQETGMEIEILMSYTTALQRGSSVAAAVTSALLEWDLL